MADAMPYLKEIKISTNAMQGQGQTPSQTSQAGAGQAGMPWQGIPMGGGLSQPTMPLQWLQRGGFQPGKASNIMNFPTTLPGIPQQMQFPQTPQQPQMTFPPFMR